MHHMTENEYLGLCLLRLSPEARQGFAQKGFWPKPPITSQLIAPSRKLLSAAAEFASLGLFSKTETFHREGDAWISIGNGIPSAAALEFFRTHPMRDSIRKVSINRAGGKVNAYVRFEADHVLPDFGEADGFERATNFSEFVKRHPEKFPTTSAVLGPDAEIHHWEDGTLSITPLEEEVSSLQTSFANDMNCLAWFRLAIDPKPPRWAPAAARGNIRGCDAIAGGFIDGEILDMDRISYAVHAVVGGVFNAAMPKPLHEQVRAALRKAQDGGIFDGLPKGLPRRGQMDVYNEIVANRLYAHWPEITDPGKRFEKAEKVVLSVIRPHRKAIDAFINEEMMRIAYGR